MAKGSQKRKQYKIKEAKAKIHSLEDERALEFIAKLSNDWIPESVAVSPTKDEQETKKFLICFDFLNSDECILEPFQPSHARALMSKLKKFTDCEIRQKSTIIRDSVLKSSAGAYKSLFNKLSLDVERLHEIGFAGDGRIFFFNVGEKLNIVSVETLHRNISK